jgi:hypothetical protein
MAANAFFSVQKTKGGVEFWEHIPFNPILYGWEFKEACCCNIKFTKGDVLLSVTDKGKVFVKTSEKTLAFNIPENQLEFLILDYGINTADYVSAAKSVKVTDSHGHH